MLTNLECRAIHEKNAGEICWIESLCENDSRMVLRNSSQSLHVFMSSGYDQDEQAQAARLCAAVNDERKQYATNHDINYTTHQRLTQNRKNSS